VFFSEEKNQKTFASGACEEIPAKASIVEAEGGKSLLLLFFRKEDLP